MVTLKRVPISSHLGIRQPKGESPFTLPIQNPILSDQTSTEFEGLFSQMSPVDRSRTAALPNSGRTTKRLFTSVMCPQGLACAWEEPTEATRAKIPASAINKYFITYSPSL